MARKLTAYNKCMRRELKGKKGGKTRFKKAVRKCKRKKK